MRHVGQTRFGFPTQEDPRGGNCFQACVASILELPLERVPDFCNEAPASEWFERLARWLDQFGLVPLTLDAKRSPALPCWQILSGPSPRKPEHGPHVPGAKYFHSVVGFAGKVAMDPHPSGDGLLSVVEVDVFVVVDAARSKP